MQGQPHIVKLLDVYREVDVLVSRKIPENEDDHFAKYRSGYQIEQSVNVVSLELCPYGDLFDVVSKNGPILDDTLLRYVFLQVCDGVKALHTKANLAHVDLKLENVLIGEDARVKLGDFGMS